MRAPLQLIRALPVFCLLCLPALASAQTQYKIELATCEDIKIAETTYGINTVETATCVNPTTTLKPKGTLRNVFIVATLPAVPTGAGITFMVTKNDANGEYVYIIAWGKRETMEHRGNLKEYFAKMTLTVK